MTWDEIKLKYPEPRDHMTKEREREFVSDCFDCYEAEGFAKKFWSPYEQPKERTGQEFEVIGRITEKDCDLCVLPIWTIRFVDGTIIGAYPEEIIPSEMKANGCDLEDIR